MYQRPYTQGKVAFENLITYLMKETNPHSAVRLSPHVIFRSNLSLFSGRIIDTDEETESSFSVS
jgi:LacI family transcriptional regulator